MARPTASSQPPLTLITGGIRSGKSEFAERVARGIGDRIGYVATGAPADPEMQTRIALHRRRRPPSWITVEARAGLMAESLRPHAADIDGILLDDLGGLATWAVMHTSTAAEAAAVLEREEEGFWLLARSTGVPAVVVTSEVGLSLVPPNELGRRFTDVLGDANQRWARAATEVIFVVAGLPWRVK